MRMEIAKSNAEKSKDGLYQRIGGESGLKQFLNRLFELIAIDSRLRKPLHNRSIDNFKSGLKVYLTELLGGPKIFKGKPLDEIHRQMHLDDYIFDCFLSDIEKTMAGLNFPEGVCDEFLATIEPIRSVVLGRYRGLQAKSKLVDNKTILERIGGELNLEAIIETVFNGCVNDPRVKYFFQVSASKLDELKSKMAALLTSLCGGAQTYDARNIRNAHYYMNLQDFMVDAVIENFQIAAELMGVESSALADFMEILGRARADVTAGATVRLEVGRQKSDQEASDFQSIYSRLGGESAMNNFVKELYTFIDQDDRIGHFFRGAKAEAIKKVQSLYIIIQFGAPLVYTGRSLASSHALLQISDFHFDAFVENCCRALRAVGAKADCIDIAVSILEKTRSVIVSESMRNFNLRKALELANKKPLFDRLGGEPIIGKIIEGFYDRALADDRIRSFFEKNKAKIMSIKKKMTSLLLKLCGGNSNYDLTELKPVHFGLNITDYHYDAALELMLASMTTDLEIPYRTAMEVIKLLQPIRAHVTTGCTVRQELAKRNVAKDKDQLFEKVGKTDGIKKLLDMTFEIIMNDQRIKTFFSTDTLRIKQGICVYVTELLGGPKVYKGRDLSVVHQTLSVSDYHFDAFLNDLQKAMLGSGYNEIVIDEVLITLEPVRSEVLNRSRDADKTSAKFKNGQTLYDRVGGDMGLESLVEAMYDRAMEDSRTRYFFALSKSKQRQIRTKMYQYLSGAFGGPVQYDGSKLRSKHYSMNINDFHFDAILESFIESAEDHELETELIEDCMTVLNLVRSDVTTGCCVRFELAKREFEKDRRVLFDKLGGSDGISKLVDRVYELVIIDKSLSVFFDGAKVSSVIASQKVFLSGLLGSKPEYKGRSIKEIHKVLSIADYHIDSWIAHMKRALRETGQDEDIVDQVVVQIETTRSDILCK